MPSINEEKVLNSSYEAALKALLALHKEELADLNRIRTVKLHQQELIEKFEESFDTFFNYVQEYLWMVNGITQSTPSTVFHELVKTNIITDEEMKTLSHMIDHEKKLIHDHNTAEDIIKFAYALPAYDKIMTKVMQALKPAEA